MHDRDEMAQRLNRFWNAEVRGEPAAPDGLDPTLIETVRRLRLRDDAPAPDPAFVARLEVRLLGVAEHGVGPQAALCTGSTRLDRIRGHDEGASPSAPPARRDASRSRSFRLAAAAILLLALLGGATAEHAMRSRQPLVPAVPAIAVATPVGSPAGFVATYRVTGSVPVNLRSVPAGGTVVKALPPGTLLAFLDEDENAGGTIWLRVRTAKGDVGWIGEEYVEALGNAPLPSASCPISPAVEIPGAAGYFVNWGLGEPGVWLAGWAPPAGTPETFAVPPKSVAYPYAPPYGWLTPAYWVLAGTETSPVTVQGHLLPNGPPLLFRVVGRSVTATTVLDPRHPGIPVQHDDFREFPAYMIFPRAGCYEVTATWSGGSWSATIPFAAPSSYRCVDMEVPKTIPCPATPTPKH